MAPGWTWLTDAERSSVKAAYAQAGIKLIVSGKFTALALD